MARVTVEDCLARIPNRFALTVLGSRRARAISEGRGRALVECENKEGVTALREISADRVRYKESVEETLTGFIEEQRRQLRVTTGEHTFLEAASLRALEDDEDDDEEVEEPDVEELKTDPEALNKQAQGDATDSGEGDSEESASANASDGDGDSDDAETPVADPDDLDTEPLEDDDEEEESSDTEST